MAQQPAYAGVPRPVDLATVSTANTNRDGTGTIVTIATGAANGTKIQEVVAQAAVTTTAGMIRLFISVDAGSTWSLFDELPIGANTVGSSTPAFRTARIYQNLYLGSSDVLLGASTHNAESFRVFALGADL